MNLTEDLNEARELNEQGDEVETEKNERVQELTAHLEVLQRDIASQTKTIENNNMELTDLKDRLQVIQKQLDEANETIATQQQKLAAQHPTIEGSILPFSENGSIVSSITVDRSEDVFDINSATGQHRPHTRTLRSRGQQVQGRSRRTTNSRRSSSNSRSVSRHQNSSATALRKITRRRSKILKAVAQRANIEFKLTRQTTRYRESRCRLCWRWWNGQR